MFAVPLPEMSSLHSWDTLRFSVGWSKNISSDLTVEEVERKEYLVWLSSILHADCRAKRLVSANTVENIILKM